MCSTYFFELNFAGIRRTMIAFGHNKKTCKGGLALRQMTEHGIRRLRRKTKVANTEVLQDMMCSVLGTREVN